MVSHGNLLCNIALMKTRVCWEDDCLVSWLPPYHDMGLIGGILTPIYCLTRKSVFISPFSFLKDPILWLEKLSYHQATITATPNFALDLCAKRITMTEKRTEF